MMKGGIADGVEYVFLVLDVVVEGALLDAERRSDVPGRRGTIALLPEQLQSDSLQALGKGLFRIRGGGLRWNERLA